MLDLAYQFTICQISNSRRKVSEYSKQHLLSSNFGRQTWYMKNRVFIALLFCLFSLPTAIANDYVGVVAGEFRVSESGAATYNVPLSLPSGRAGVKPQVALSYNSQNLREGPLGVGWSLSVGSAITRCASTPIEDGIINAIEFNTTDHFCLDGQRLHVRSGIKGRNGTTYRLDIDNFAKITSYDNNSDGNPRYFTVETKSGETHYYGIHMMLIALIGALTDI